MIYQITSDNLEMTESMKALAQNKVSKLERYFPNTDPDLIVTRVVLNKGSEEDTFHVKLELEVAGKLYYGDETEYTLEAAIIRAIEEVEKQMEKVRSQDEKDWEKRREMKQKSLEEEEIASQEQ
jgi:ribosomal subunit interface protein